jgi:putative transposase
MTYNQCSQQLTLLKMDLPWLKQVDKFALQNSLRNLADAYSRFFKGQNERPCFKSKKNPVQSYRTNFTNDNIKMLDQYIQLPKLGKVKYANSRRVEGQIVSATIRRTPTGKYFISITTIRTSSPYVPANKEIGIDLGLKTFATCSNGEVFENPKYLRQYEDQLAKWQRSYARRKKGSKNLEKARLKIIKIHEKITNCREDHLHKISTKLIRENKTICLEDLRVSNMLKNEKLVKSINDAAWSKFLWMIKYKAHWYGRNLGWVDPFYPSSQLCSCCGTKNPEVKDLSVREWVCANCQTKQERDENASQNILNEGKRSLVA